MYHARLAKFCRLFQQAYDQPTEWLVAVLQDKKPNSVYITALQRLACLRALIARNYGDVNGSLLGLVYRDKKIAVRKSLGI